MVWLCCVIGYCWLVGEGVYYVFCFRVFLCYLCKRRCDIRFMVRKIRIFVNEIRMRVVNMWGMFSW